MQRQSGKMKSRLTDWYWSMMILPMDSPLGTTASFREDSFAFKWADEIRETTLLENEWSPSRTGLINPVAVFEPVELG